MNKATKSDLRSIIKVLEDIRERIEFIKNQEEEVFSEMSDKKQEGSSGSNQQLIIESLDNADSDLENTIDSLTECI